MHPQSTRNSSKLLNTTQRDIHKILTRRITTLFCTSITAFQTNSSITFVADIFTLPDIPTLCSTSQSDILTPIPFRTPCTLKWGLFLKLVSIGTVLILERDNHVLTIAHSRSIRNWVEARGLVTTRMILTKVFLSHNNKVGKLTRVIDSEGPTYQIDFLCSPNASPTGILYRAPIVVYSVTWIGVACMNKFF
mmetsp:Transcript_1810/g.3028  ORF Transcript_1810/g.3028 Transcript_1810/m.3028 type:complete len:192 (+) Transcript_1810:1132-1707(+)